MQHETMNIPYTAVHPGTDRTEISFFDSCQDVFQALMKRPVIKAIDGSDIELQAPRRVFVTDTTVADLPPVKQFLEGVSSRDAVVILEAGEAHKTIDSVLTIVTAAIKANMTRGCVFTGIGGGVITDMTAFAASLFKRGAGLDLVPTTLLSMVDAAIGGKTGCDFNDYKNMIGSFYPAKHIYMGTEFLKSLPAHEFRSGLAEVVKTAMLYAPKLFQILEEQKDDIMNLDDEVLMQIVKRSANAKAAVVERDLMEKGERKQLNLGHTFGHALETVAGLGKVTHGDAVAWGCGRAMELSLRLGLCEDDSYRNQVFALLDKYGYSTAPQHPALDALPGTAEEKAARLLAAMKNDKKNTDSAICCTLQREMNSTVIQDVRDEDILAVLA